MADKKAPVTRREVLLAAVPGGIAVAGIVGGAGAMLMRPAPRDPGRIMRVCALGDMDVGGQVVLPEVLVVRDQSSVHAISMRCTHLGCGLVRHERGFECPCHGSLFDDVGRPLTGPAKKPLPWYRVQLDRGTVLVDLGTVVPRGTKTVV